MKLMPDPDAVAIDPFFAQTTLSMVCDVLEPLTDEPYERDPRSIAKKAEAYRRPDQASATRSSSARKPSSSSSTTSSSRRDPYNTGFTLDDIELPINSDTDYETGNLGHRIRTKGGYFPVPPLDSLQDMRSEMLARDGLDGRQGREAPPRGGLGPARARHQVRPAGDDGRPPADLQVLHPQRRPRLRQDGDLHAEADLRRQRLGHARPPVDLEGRQAAVRRQALRRPVGGVPVLHRRHHQARQGAQRLHQPADQLLQAAGPGLRGAGAARLFVAQPLGLLPHPGTPTTRRPSASRSASPIRARTPTSPSRRC